MGDVFGEDVAHQAGKLIRRRSLFDGPAVKDYASGGAVLGGKETAERDSRLPRRWLGRRHLLDPELELPPLGSPHAL